MACPIPQGGQKTQIWRNLKHWAHIYQQLFRSPVLSKVD